MVPRKHLLNTYQPVYTYRAYSVDQAHLEPIAHAPRNIVLFQCHTVTTEDTDLTSQEQVLGSPLDLYGRSSLE